MNLLITLHHHHFNLKCCNLLEYTKNIKLLFIIFFCNIPNFEIKNSVSGNITTPLSDDLSQFFLILDFFSNSSPSKYNTMTHYLKNFNSQEFLECFNKTNWNENLQLNKNSVNISFNKYLDNINTLITKHAPIKKLNKKQRKFLQKPWLTWSIQNSILKKNRLFKKFIKCKNPNTKTQEYDEYKLYRNWLSTLMKKRKQKYFNNYFQTNVKNIKNTWNRIKSIIYLKAKYSESLKSIKAKHGETITNPKLTADNFDNFFC